MPTTIQVADDTKRLLKQLKAKSNAPSYDAVIDELICHKEKIPRSLYGRHPDL